MRRVLALITLVLAATPAVASAATLKTAAACYQETADVVLSGAGFTPLAKVSITSNRKPIATATADANGAFIGRFATPALPDGTREKLYELSATDTLNTGVTLYRATRVFADYSPASGNSRTLKVRYSVNGFGLVRRRPGVYLHYVAPDGRSTRTVRIGTATGTCGLIRSTSERRLFPFDARRGNWILQFDTNRTYVRGTRRSRFPWVRKAVEVFATRS